MFRLQSMWKLPAASPPNPPTRGRRRAFKKAPKKGKVLFKFWLVDVHLFDGALACPPSKPERYSPLFNSASGACANGRIYLRDIDMRTFFHEALHRVVARCAPHLHGRAVNEALAETAAVAAVELGDVPRGAGWSLIEAAKRGPRREVVHYVHLGHLSERCVFK